MDLSRHSGAHADPLRGSRVAFFGGSFDPPHLGHLAVARAARAALSLDIVLFAPVGAQPLKPLGSTAFFADRLAMTRLAIAGDPGFAVSLADAPKPDAAPNYTLETLLELRAGLPPVSVLYCLMGADSFAGFRRWHRSAEIPYVAPLIVASRPGQPLDRLQAGLPEGLSMEAAPSQYPASSQVELRGYRLRNPAGECAPFYLLPGLQVDISASEIREQMRMRGQFQADRQGQTPERELIPQAVAEYIGSHRLYR